jgi:retron-type reverse transcriptase
LIQSWLRVGRRYRNPDRGIALGMPISPLFCNVYLHRLDWALVRRRWSPVRYADDLVVCCVIRRQAEQARQVTASILDGLRLKLEPTKTQITSFDQGFEFLGVRFQGDTYSFTWEGKRFEVEGPTPHWIWGYVPSEYE